MAGVATEPKADQSFKDMRVHDEEVGGLELFATLDTVVKDLL